MPKRFSARGLVGTTRCPKKQQMALATPASQRPLVELGNSLSCRSRRSLHTSSLVGVDAFSEMWEPALFITTRRTD